MHTSCTGSSRSLALAPERVKEMVLGPIWRRILSTMGSFAIPRRERRLCEAGYLERGSAMRSIPRETR
jgi:hypothetical protein